MHVVPVHGDHRPRSTVAHVHRRPDDAVANLQGAIGDGDARAEDGRDGVGQVAVRQGKIHGLRGDVGKSFASGGRIRFLGCMVVTKTQTHDACHRFSMASIASVFAGHGTTQTCDDLKVMFNNGEVTKVNEERTSCCSNPTAEIYTEHLIPFCTERRYSYVANDGTDAHVVSDHTHADIATHQCGDAFDAETSNNVFDMQTKSKCFAIDDGSGATLKNDIVLNAGGTMAAIFPTITLRNDYTYPKLEGSSLVILANMLATQACVDSVHDMEMLGSSDYMKTAWDDATPFRDGQSLTGLSGLLFSGGVGNVSVAGEQKPPSYLDDAGNLYPNVGAIPNASIATMADTLKRLTETQLFGMEQRIVFKPDMYTEMAQCFAAIMQADVAANQEQPSWTGMFGSQIHTKDLSAFTPGHPVRQMAVQMV